MKSILPAIKLTTLLASLTLFAGCAGSSNGGDEYEVPTNLPPICRDIDFAENPDMREMCGVRKAHNKAYKNIPQQRYLIKPSETTRGRHVEVRECGSKRREHRGREGQYFFHGNVPIDKAYAFSRLLATVFDENTLVMVVDFIAAIRFSDTQSGTAVAGHSPKGASIIP